MLWALLQEAAQVGIKWRRQPQKVSGAGVVQQALVAVPEGAGERGPAQKKLQMVGSKWTHTHTQRERERERKCVCVCV